MQHVSSWNLEAIKRHAASVSSACGRVAGAGTVKSRVVSCSSHSCRDTSLKCIVNALVIILIVDICTAVLRRGRGVRSNGGWTNRSRLLRLGHWPSRVHVTRMLYTTPNQLTTKAQCHQVHNQHNLAVAIIVKTESDKKALVRMITPLQSMKNDVSQMSWFDPINSFLWQRYWTSINVKHGRLTQFGNVNIMCILFKQSGKDHSQNLSELIGPYPFMCTVSKNFMKIHPKASNKSCRCRGQTEKQTNRQTTAKLASPKW